MLSQIRPAIVMMVLFTAADRPRLSAGDHRHRQVVLPDRPTAACCPARRDGRRLGLIGQNFATDTISMAAPRRPARPIPTDPDQDVDAPYNAANSTGSNLGPTSQKLVDRVKADVEAKRAAGCDRADPGRRGDDLGLRASTRTSRREYALAQVAAVAKARNLPRTRCALSSRPISKAASLGFIGEPRVNVLLLNMALDALTPS